MRRKPTAQEYPDPDDMFADTRMSFGEHIEDLRSHLLRAIKWFVLALVVSFFIGKPVLRFIAKPVEEQLMEFWNRYYYAKNQEIIEKIRDGSMDPRSITVPTFHLDIKDLDEALGMNLIRQKLKIPNRYDEPLQFITPAILRVLENVDMAELMERKYAVSSRFVEAKPDLIRYLRSVENTNSTLRPPMLSTLSVQEAFLVYFKVCLLAALVISAPLVFYEIWAFIAAGLYPHEKRLVNVYMPFSAGLFIVGTIVCELFVIPRAIEALLWFNEWMGFQPDLRLNEWLGFAIFMPVIFGVSFQTPLVMLFLAKLGIFGVEDFRSKRKIALMVMAVVAAVITPSTDALSLLFLWVPMSLLYEFGILLCLMSPREPWMEMEPEESEEMVEV